MTWVWFLNLDSGEVVERKLSIKAKYLIESRNEQLQIVFLTSTDSSISEVFVEFGFPWTSPSVNSPCCQINECSNMTLGL